MMQKKISSHASFTESDKLDHQWSHKLEEVSKEEEEDNKRKITVTRVVSILFWVISLGLAAFAALLIRLDSRPGDSNVLIECAVGAVVFFLILLGYMVSFGEMDMQGD